MNFDLLEKEALRLPAEQRRKLIAHLMAHDNKAETDWNAMGPAHLSEAALAEDWNRPEEDAAWSPLQPGQ